MGLLGCVWVWVWVSANRQMVDEVDVKSGPVCPCPEWAELNQLAQGTDDSADLALRAAAAKVFDSETAWEVCDDPCTQPHPYTLHIKLGAEVRSSCFLP